MVIVTALEVDGVAGKPHSPLAVAAAHVRCVADTAAEHDRQDDYGRRPRTRLLDESTDVAADAGDVADAVSIGSHCAKMAADQRVQMVYALAEAAHSLAMPVEVAPDEVQSCPREDGDSLAVLGFDRVAIDWDRLQRNQGLDADRSQGSSRRPV